MVNRVHTARAAGENRLRPWIVYVDGEKLRSNRGAVRHFKWEHMARSAGWKSLGMKEGANGVDLPDWRTAMSPTKEQWAEALWAAMRDLAIQGNGTVKAMNIHTVRLFCDEAEKKLGAAGLVIVPESFVINFREFVSDWQKGDFALPELAKLDVQACLTALDGDGGCNAA